MRYSAENISQKGEAMDHQRTASDESDEPDPLCDTRKPGECITYRAGEHITTGMIVQVFAAQDSMGGSLPVTYLVVPNHQDRLPCLVWPSDILEPQ